MNRMILTGAIALALAACGKPATPDKDAASAGSGAASTALVRINDGVVDQGMVDALLRQRGIPEPTSEDSARAVQDIEKVMLMAQEGERRKLEASPQFAADMALLRLSRLADFTADKVIAEKPVTEAEIKTEYETKVATISGKEYEVRQMLFSKEAEALAAIGELLNGADFAATGEALTKGRDDAQAGDLGWINLAQVPPEFAAVLPGLAAGDFTKVPIKTSFGFHVLRVNQTRPLNAPSFEEVSAGVKQSLEKKRIDSLIQELKKAAKIEPVTG